LGTIPNPQSPIPNPQFNINIFAYILFLKNYIKVFFDKIKKFLLLIFIF